MLELLLDEHPSLFIGGAWVASVGDEVLDVQDPATEEILASVVDATCVDVDRAVQAAVAALPAWTAQPLVDRQRLVRAAAIALAERQEGLAALVSAETGAARSAARWTQVGRPIQVLRSLCDSADDVPWKRQVGRSVVTAEPVGVVAAITSWDFPMLQALTKVGAALLAGCTVVLKPAELAPLTCLAVAEVFRQVGLPPGVLNVVTGRGSGAGEALLAHHDVDAVTFTGSDVVGKHVALSAANSMKRVSLGVAGRSVSLILDAAAVSRGVEATMRSCMDNAGQSPTSLSRLLVPKPLMGYAAELAALHAVDLRMGMPDDEQTSVGPVVSRGQQLAVLELVESALATGAVLRAGGPGTPLPSTGFFVAPTVLSDVDESMDVATCDVYGPVLSISGYDSVEQAVALINASSRVLGVSIWSKEDSTALGVGRRLRVGVVGINDVGHDIFAPIGGMRGAGSGRELGVAGITQFTELRSMTFQAGEAAMSA